MTEVIEDLLSGVLKLHTGTAPVVRLIDVLTYPCWKRECDAVSVVWEVDREAHDCQRCGLHIEESISGPLFDKRAQRDPDVVAHVTAWARRRAELAPMAMTYSHTAGGSYDAFQCHACRGILGDMHLMSAFSGARYEDDLDVVIGLPIMADRPFPTHWCRATGLPTRVVVSDAA